MHLKTAADREVRVYAVCNGIALDVFELDGEKDTVCTDLTTAEALRIAQALIKAVRDVG